jgi:hypothetical protein
MPSGRKVAEKGETIKINDLLRGMDYARWDHPTTMRAFIVMNELNKWIDKTVIAEEAPFVAIVVSRPVVSLTIGDVCVWCSESDSVDDLTLDICKDTYREEILRAAAVLEL